MEPTVLVYASHDRCNVIHDAWIVQRALRGNKRLLFLPLSAASDDERDLEHQLYDWGNFRRFFDYYRPFGLDAFPFLWRKELQPADVEPLWHALATAEVVILGGSNPGLGRRRYAELGSAFASDPERFPSALRERAAAGLLTVGYSAGVDQLCEYMSTQSGFGAATPGFGLARQVIATSHFVPGQEPWLQELARAFPGCAVFGLPNDSGLAVGEGTLPSGGRFQRLEVITDLSWDAPADAYHIRTRQGMPVQHHYPDGRHWGFNGGDVLLRLWPADGSPAEAWIAVPGRPLREYRSQQDTAFATVEELLAARG